MKFVNQCGVIVRARIPITTKLWKSSKPEEQQYAMPPHQKEMLRTELNDMFTLPEGVDEELVKKCALKKMMTLGRRPIISSTFQYVS